MTSSRRRATITLVHRAGFSTSRGQPSPGSVPCPGPSASYACTRPWSKRHLARTQEERDLTVYGPMLGTWSQMWQWMWQMQLVWMLPLLITVTAVVVAIVVRTRRPSTPTGPTAR